MTTDVVVIEGALAVVIAVVVAAAAIAAVVHAVEIDTGDGTLGKVLKAVINENALLLKVVTWC